MARREVRLFLAYIFFPLGSIGVLSGSGGCIMRLVGSQYIRIARRSGASLGGRVSMAAFALFFRSCILFLADYFLEIDKGMEASAPPSENLSDTICPRCTVTIWPPQQICCSAPSPIQRDMPAHHDGE